MATAGATIRERQANVIARLIAEREDLRGQLANRPVRVVSAGRRTQRCCYCGQTCHGTACHAHSDLLALDPFYSARAIPDRRATGASA